MKYLNSLITQPQKVLNLSKQVVQRIQYNRYLPKNHVVEDIFLVSYPKSGNTWLRFLIANAIKVHYQIDQDINFFSILGIIPSPRGNTNLRPEGPFGRTDIPRIIKSHSAYNPYYYRVLWLVRDPRDVMISYYYYLQELKQIPDTMSLSEFIRHPKHGVESWKNHTTSWYFQPKPANQFVKAFKYEDFLENPKLQLSSLMELLGIIMNDHDLEEAIILSSRDRMKESEKKHLFVYNDVNKFSFVRKQKSDCKQKLSNPDKKFIENSTLDIASLIGYNF